MIIRIIIIVLLVMGMILGSENTEEVTKIDNIWKEYEHEEGFAIPESIMKGLMFIVAKIVFIGFTLAIWVYPHGLIVATILLVISLINFQWILYPFLFVYVLFEERKKQPNIPSTL